MALNTILKLDESMDNRENIQCTICREDLSKYPTYEDKKCNHTFHTHCIVTWYRDLHDYCPQCSKKRKSIRRGRNCYLGYLHNNIVNKKISMYRNLSKKHPDISFLKKQLEILDTLNEKSKEYQTRRIHITKYIKENKLNFEEGCNYKKEIFKDRWKHVEAYNKKRLEIFNLPVIPIIIPEFVDLT